MIVTEYFMTRDDGVVLNRTYSDAGMMIMQVGTGARYSDAIDPVELNRQYIETDEPIPESDIPAEEALDILLGVRHDN